jgi:hypothetical protein
MTPLERIRAERDRIAEEHVHSTVNCGSDGLSCPTLRLVEDKLALAKVLVAVRPHVVASAESQHMLDGFGPRERRAADLDLEQIDQTLARVSR